MHPFTPAVRLSQGRSPSPCDPRRTGPLTERVPPLCSEEERHRGSRWTVHTHVPPFPPRVAGEDDGEDRDLNGDFPTTLTLGTRYTPTEPPGRTPRGTYSNPDSSFKVRVDDGNGTEIVDLPAINRESTGDLRARRVSDDPLTGDAVVTTHGTGARGPVLLSGRPSGS